MRPSLRLVALVALGFPLLACGRISPEGLPLPVGAEDEPVIDASPRPHPTRDGGGLRDSSSDIPDVEIIIGPDLLRDPCVDAYVPRSCCLSRLKYGGLAGANDTCGPLKNESCCAFDDIPGGSFFRMNNPALPATLPSFKLGRYLVTTARFSVFMDEGGGRQDGLGSPPVSPAAGSGAHPTLGAVTGWQPEWNFGDAACGGQGCLAKDATELRTRVYKDPATQGWGCTLDHYPEHPKLPMSCVTQYEANAFCAWDGGYLITEAMWEYATRGGSEQRTFAWGSHPPDSLDFSVYCIQGGGRWGVGLWCTNPAIPLPADVGHSAVGQGKFGTYDLQGNLMNLTTDQRGPMPPSCGNDCVSRPAVDPGRSVARGISFRYPNNLMPAEYTNLINQRSVAQRYSYNGANFGFRCAYPNSWKPK